MSSDAQHLYFHRGSGSDKSSTKCYCVLSQRKQARLEPSDCLSRPSARSGLRRKVRTPAESPMHKTLPTRLSDNYFAYLPFIKVSAMCGKKYSYIVFICGVRPWSSGERDWFARWKSRSLHYIFLLVFLAYLELTIGMGPGTSPVARQHYLALPNTINIVLCTYSYYAVRDGDLQ